MSKLKKKMVKMPMGEFKREHDRLLKVLDTPSRKDDKVEAKKQKKEMKEYGVKHA